MIWPFGRKPEPPADRGSALRAAAPTGLREGWFEHMLRASGFLQRYPQFAGVVARMHPILTDRVPIMAVGLRRWDDTEPRFHLLVNPGFLRDHPEQLVGVLLHEVHHIVLGHLSNLELHAVANPMAMEVAMEISANENIHEPLPPSVLDVGRFSAFGITPGQSTLQRYALLAEAVRRGRLQLPDLRTASWDLHRPRQAGGAAIGAGDLIDGRSDGATTANWSRSDGRSGRSGSRELERMRQAIATHLGGERGGGDVAAGGRRRVAKELPRRLLGHDPARLDWPRLLRDAFPRQRQVHPDYKRPNRRFPERVGELPGRTRRPPRPHLLAAIDTSGSMDIATLRQIAGEVRQLRRHAQLSIILCDAAAHRLPPFADLDVMTGGGDTDFAPVFAELPAIPGCVGVVYFTDGRGELPTRPPAVPTLWVLTRDGSFAPGFGTIARLPAAIGW